MLIFNFISILLDFVDFILDKFDVVVNYNSYLTGLEVWSYGVHVLGALITSVISFYTFKVVFSIFNWLWKQLPLTWLDGVFMKNVIFLKFNDNFLSLGCCVQLHHIDFDVVVGTLVGYSDNGLEVLSLNGMVYFCEFSSILELEKIAWPPYANRGV